MNDLRELYQQLIIDHGRKPRNFGELTHPTFVQEGFNPLCGDKITLFVMEEEGKIKDLKFTGSGCAISMASASLMTEALKGKSVDSAFKLFDAFHEVVLGAAVDKAELGKLVVLAGVADYPARVKCATLCWHTLMAALKRNEEVVSTE